MSDLLKKDIRYLGRDFNSIKSNLIDFAKTYFPNTYQDFNESSPGMMFLEMAAYVGDVLSYYTDVTLQESMITHAAERQNVINLAQSMGYIPRNKIASVVRLDLFQLLPSIDDGFGIMMPDWKYALAINEGMTVSSKSTTNLFRTTEYVDFKFVNCHLSNCNLSNRNLTRVVFEQCWLININFENSILVGSNIINSNLSNSNLSRCNLSGCNLNNSRLYKAQLMFSNMTNCNLTNTKLSVV